MTVTPPPHEPEAARPRLLIEEWLPARALGVECMRENSTGLHPPPNRLHVWWARRPLAVSRAAVLGSLLPADFDRATFERLLGFGRPGDELVAIREWMDTGMRVPGGFGCKRAFSNSLRQPDVASLRAAVHRLWGSDFLVLDSMAGGGSIPFEAARLGLPALANEYNGVACAVLEATLNYPFRLGERAASAARRWAKTWEERAAVHLAPYYPREPLGAVHAYIFARTVPCPDTKGHHPTPLVPDWSLSRPAGKPHLVAEPTVIDKATGDWTIRVRQVGPGAGMLRQAPRPTYRRGNGWSLFADGEMDADYIKAQAQQGHMGYRLYAVATKATRLEFRPPQPRDFAALAAAEAELARLRPRWEAEGIIPTEAIPEGEKTREALQRGMTRWADLFAPRQLLAAGVLVEELRALQPEILAAEGPELGEAVVHLLAFVLDKFVHYNCIASRWHAPRTTIAPKFDRHDYAFKATFAEMAACVSGAGLAWAVDNVLDAYEKLCALPRAPQARPAQVNKGSATALWELADGSVTAVVMDPPYAGNVQYSELADFFYVWLKRTLGPQRPAWFQTLLSERDDEAVENMARHREDASRRGAARARAQARKFYRQKMAAVFAEARRVLRDDGVLTVMFTHKEQAAWASLFAALIQGGFAITATWPVMTESQHSLHQARKNAAQSTVLLVARKRTDSAGSGYYSEALQAELARAAREAAARLEAQGLNRVDQLVGAFGPAMAVYSRYAEVRYDTGEPVPVSEALQAAADAVAAWRVEQIASRGLDGVDPESRFVLLCWDVLGAQEFRFNEAMLLGRAVGMDVSDLLQAGLLEKKGANVHLLPAAERRRDRPVENLAQQLTLLANTGRRTPRRKIHPADGAFGSAIDMCHAAALRYAEAGGDEAGIGAARRLAAQQGWRADSPCARLMLALVNAAPEAVRFAGDAGRKTAADQFPEFRAWHALLEPLFRIQPPEWKRPPKGQLSLEV